MDGEHKMFVHLHVHSHYSFLDSTLRVEDIVEAARRANMDAVALTDTNGLYAVVPFVKACREAGLRPIIGAEIDGFDPDEANARGVVLARDAQGYAELSRLVTQRRLAEPLPVDALDAVDAKREGEWDEDDEDGRGSSSERYGDGWAPDPTVCFSPGPQFEGTLLDSLLALSEGHVWILTDSPALLRLLAGQGNVFCELILTRRRRGFCRRLYDLARALRIPMVATCDVHFARPGDYSLFRLLRAIGLQKTVETLDDVGQAGAQAGAQAGSLCYRYDPGSSRYPHNTANLCYQDAAGGLCRPHGVVDEEHYFKTADEMERAFRGLRVPLRNTRYIAERCNVDLGLGRWKFPRVTLPPGETAFSRLWKVTFDGLKRRYRPLTPEATRRLEHELEVIARLGYAEYFLAVHEIAEAAERRGFLMLGRGSAANSIVSFALGLTPVDPIRHNLYFERFLNAERRSPPDIDLDFSWKDRDEVVRWIFDHFGHDRVALIATHITLQPRQAIREAAKAMGVAEAEVNRFTRFIPGWLSRDKRLAELPEVFPECRDLPFDDEPWKTIVDHAQRILDFPRHLSIHCGGLLITPDPITDYTPLQRAAKGPIITQMEMHAIEDLGLIKMDILSNRSLGVLTDCLEMLSDRRNQNGRQDSIDVVRLVQQQ